ncbi:MAG: ABC transporter ATP-binding protein [Clostridia bacterium]
MRDIVLHVSGLYFSYDRLEVLKGLDMDCERGRLYCVIGPNGCGKSTLVKNMTGILSPAKGQIFIEGRDIRSLKHKERARIIAYVPQETVAYFDFTVFDIVSMGRNPYHSGLDSLNREDVRIIEKAMDQTGVSSLRDKCINELSGGEKQSVIIARALAQDTDIILMDEPVSSLDINHQVEIMDTVKKLTKQGKTVVCVLHDLNLAAQYADELVLIHGGKVVSKGNAEQVLTVERISLVYHVDVLVEHNLSADRRIILPLSKNHP